MNAKAFKCHTKVVERSTPVNKAIEGDWNCLLQWSQSFYLTEGLALLCFPTWATGEKNRTKPKILNYCVFWQRRRFYTHVFFKIEILCKPWRIFFFFSNSCNFQTFRRKSLNLDAFSAHCGRCRRCCLVWGATLCFSKSSKVETLLLHNILRLSTIQDAVAFFWSPIRPSIPLTPDTNRTFSSTQPQLSGNVLILGPFSGNPGDGCYAVKISIDQQFVKHSDLPVWKPTTISHSKLVSRSFLMFILNFGKSSSLFSACVRWVSAIWLDGLLFLLSFSSFYDFCPGLSQLSMIEGGVTTQESCQFIAGLHRKTTAHTGGQPTIQNLLQVRVFSTARWSQRTRGRTVSNQSPSCCANITYITTERYSLLHSCYLQHLNHH